MTLSYTHIVMMTTSTFLRSGLIFIVLFFFFFFEQHESEKKFQLQNDYLASIIGVVVVQALVLLHGVQVPIFDYRFSFFFFDLNCRKYIYCHLFPCSERQVTLVVPYTYSIISKHLILFMAWPWCITVIFNHEHMLFGPS